MLDEDLNLRFSNNIQKENLACMILGNKNFGLQDKYNLYALGHEIIRFLSAIELMISIFTGIGRCTRLYIKGKESEKYRIP